MKQWLLILMIGLPLVLSAQSGNDNVKSGTVEIICNPEIDSLMGAVKRNVEKDPVIKGYRVQILAAGSRADINKIKGQFYTLFPDMKTFVIYQQPNFKLRVGNFRTKLDAYKAWTEIIKHFPSAFITPDELKISEL